MGARSTQDNGLWVVALIAEKGRDDLDLSETALEMAATAAKNHGARLTYSAGRYSLRFEARALDLPSASRHGMAQWARLFEVCRLPDWPLVSLTIDRPELAPSSIVADRMPRRRPGAACWEGPGAQITIDPVDGSCVLAPRAPVAASWAMADGLCVCDDVAC